MRERRREKDCASCVSSCPTCALRRCAGGSPPTSRLYPERSRPKPWNGSSRSRNSMPIRRGNVVTVAAAGYYGKPRPAIIVQTDVFPESSASVVICQLTSEIVHAPDFRILVEPDAGNGLRLRSQIMADKPVTVRRDRIGQRIGRLGGGASRGSMRLLRSSWALPTATNRVRLRTTSPTSRPDP